MKNTDMCRLAIVEYRTSKTAYVINSVLNLATVSAKDIADTRAMCEAKGGYYKILKYKNL